MREPDKCLYVVSPLVAWKCQPGVPLLGDNKGRASHLGCSSDLNGQYVLSVVRVCVICARSATRGHAVAMSVLEAAVKHQYGSQHQYRRLHQQALLLVK